MPDDVAAEPLSPPDDGDHDHPGECAGADPLTRPVPGRHPSGDGDDAISRALLRVVVRIDDGAGRVDERLVVHGQVRDWLPARPALPARSNRLGERALDERLGVARQT